MSENSERIRIVGSVPVDDDTMIWIDHVFTMGASPDDDPGYVGLDGHRGRQLRGTASASAPRRPACSQRGRGAAAGRPAPARGATLSSETDEDLPDPEREYRRYRGNEDPPGSVADLTTG